LEDVGDHTEFKFIDLPDLLEGWMEPRCWFGDSINYYPLYRFVTFERLCELRVEAYQEGKAMLASYEREKALLDEQLAFHEKVIADRTETIRGMYWRMGKLLRDQEEAVKQEKAKKSNGDGVRELEQESATKGEMESETEGGDTKGGGTGHVERSGLDPADNGS
jgi:hypothetical protein